MSLLNQHNCCYSFVRGASNGWYSCDLWGKCLSLVVLFMCQLITLVII